MNPTRKRRLWLVLAVVAAAIIATTLIAMALQRNVAYLYTPDEVLSGDAGSNVSSGEARLIRSRCDAGCTRSSCSNVASGAS